LRIAQIAEALIRPEHHQLHERLSRFLRATLEQRAAVFEARNVKRAASLPLNTSEEVSMSAYLIVHRRKITDAESLKRYDNVEATIGKFGGKVLIRSDEFLVLEGRWQSGSSSDDARPERITVIEFSDMAQLRRWYDSQDYAQLKEIRKENSASDIVAVEGAAG
jgi:uncharacterized protein (DUF1330 family)